MNRDALHSFGGRAIARSGGPGCAAPGGSPDSAGRRHAGCTAWPVWRSRRRSRSGRGRKSCKSAPRTGTPRTKTAGRARPRRLRHLRPHRSSVDDRSDWRNTRPAFVPSTVWGTASSVTAKFRSAPCLPLNRGKLLPRLRAAVSTGATPLPNEITPAKIAPGPGRLKSGRTPRPQTARATRPAIIAR